MSKHFKAWLILWIVSTGAGLEAIDPRINLADKHDLPTIEFYSNGDLKASRALTPQESKDVGNMLARKTGKWRSNSNTFAPMVEIRAKAFQLIFQQHVIIAEFQDKDGNWLQEIASLNDGEFAQIKSFSSNNSK